MLLAILRKSMGKIHRGNLSMQFANSLAVCPIPRIPRSNGVFFEIALKLLAVAE
jgi:hypothetical protein